MKGIHNEGDFFAGVGGTDIDGIEIGDGARIYQGAYLGPDSKIGTGCTIGQYVHVGPRVVIHDRCKVQNGAQLFEGVTLHADVFVGPHVVFTNVLTPRAFVDRRLEFKETHVGRGASIGANATILCGITIGEYAMIGAGSVVTRPVAPFALVVGVPARHDRWVCKCGELLPPAPGGISPVTRVCERCKARYKMTGVALTPEA